jgi:hypothetical protein
MRNPTSIASISAGTGTGTGVEVAVLVHRYALQEKGLLGQ